MHAGDGRSKNDVSEQDHHAAHGGADMHIWLDIDNASAIVEAIAAALVEADPGRAGLYRSNAEHTQARLQDLDQELRSALTPLVEPAIHRFPRRLPLSRTPLRIDSGRLDHRKPGTAAERPARCRSSQEDHRKRRRLHFHRAAVRAGAGQNADRRHEHPRGRARCRRRDRRAAGTGGLFHDHARYRQGSERLPRPGQLSAGAMLSELRQEDPRLAGTDKHRLTQLQIEGMELRASDLCLDERVVVGQRQLHFC